MSRKVVISLEFALTRRPRRRAPQRRRGLTIRLRRGNHKLHRGHKPRQGRAPRLAPAATSTVAIAGVVEIQSTRKLDGCSTHPTTPVMRAIKASSRSFATHATLANIPTLAQVPQSSAVKPKAKRQV